MNELLHILLLPVSIAVSREKAKKKKKKGKGPKAWHHFATKNSIFVISSVKLVPLSVLHPEEKRPKWALQLRVKPCPRASPAELGTALFLMAAQPQEMLQAPAQRSPLPPREQGHSMRNWNGALQNGLRQ